MQIINIPLDITSMYIQAASFPHGAEAAHKQFRAKLPDAGKRRFFAISYSDGKGGIIYRAAAEELQKGEASSLGLETFTIRKGKYISEILKDWLQHEKEIGRIFQELLKYPGIAPNGYCLEEYFTPTDLRLSVILAW